MPQTGKARRKEAAIAALLSAPTLAKAAELSEVSIRTLRRWLEDPGFSKAYAKAKGELVVFATGRLKGAMAKAVEVLEQVAEAKDNPPPARVSAARAILELGMYSHEAEGLQEKIAELERQVAEDNPERR
ncbi:MAG TPA: hypothetical protein VHZ09_03735 [Acidobacteriaceae bacterium]|jgi:hypothetical protein|nr:hypothetical protein [Acidobacteriaceae bacterium]